MNVELLNKIKERITEEPRQFDMGTWFSPYSPEIPNCGTAACIAGWALAISYNENPQRANLLALKEGTGYALPASRFLGLSYLESTRLFYTNQWPLRFFWAYHEEGISPKEKARIACERIDQFIATNGAE